MACPPGQQSLGCCDQPASGLKFKYHFGYIQLNGFPYFDDPDQERPVNALADVFTVVITILRDTNDDDVLETFKATLRWRTAPNPGWPHPGFKLDFEEVEYIPDKATFENEHSLVRAGVFQQILNTTGHASRERAWLNSEGGGHTILVQENISGDLYPSVLPAMQHLLNQATPLVDMDWGTGEYLTYVDGGGVNVDNRAFGCSPTVSGFNEWEIPGDCGAPSSCTVTLATILLGVTISFPNCVQTFQYIRAIAAPCIEGETLSNYCIYHSVRRNSRCDFEQFPYTCSPIASNEVLLEPEMSGARAGADPQNFHLMTLSPKDPAHIADCCRP